jgi:hypothetical protein
MSEDGRAVNEWNGRQMPKVQQNKNGVLLPRGGVADEEVYLFFLRSNPSRDYSEMP